MVVLFVSFHGVTLNLMDQKLQARNMSSAVNHLFWRIGINVHNILLCQGISSEILFTRVLYCWFDGGGVFFYFFSFHCKKILTAFPWIIFERNRPEITFSDNLLKMICAWLVWSEAFLALTMRYIAWLMSVLQVIISMVAYLFLVIVTRERYKEVPCLFLHICFR